MSVLPPKADIWERRNWNVRYGPISLFTVTAIFARRQSKHEQYFVPTDRWLSGLRQPCFGTVHGYKPCRGFKSLPCRPNFFIFISVASIGENLRTARRHRSCLQQRKSAPNSCFTIGRKARTQPSQNIRPKNRQLVNSPLSYAPSGWRAKQERTSLNLSRSQRPSKRI